MQLTPIRTRSVSEAVYEQLRDAILSGDLEVGQQLPGERKLCEILEVNRGALREALKRLEQDQLITVLQGEGTRILDFRESARVDLLMRLIVRPTGELDPEVARSVAELRNVITPDIARLAALRRSPTDLERLHSVVESLRRSVDRPGLFQDQVEEFWSVLTESGRNVAYRLLNNTMRQLHVQFSHKLHPLLGEEFMSVDCYAEIAQAVTQGDADRAATLARIHATRVTLALGVDAPAP